MHGSTAGLRPRQRTSTSCTECRRRKQKCNQAKDRPCNNCARRYPPVVCTYDSRSSSSSAVDRVVDLRGREDAVGRRDDQSASNYGSASGSADYSDAVVYTSSSHPYYAPVYSTSYSTPTTNQYSSSNIYASSSSDTTYYPTVASSAVGGQAYDASYYTPTYSGYSTQGDWLSSTGDPRAFVGSGTSYDALPDMPLDPSRRNADLYQFYHQSLAPYLVTIDGLDPPPAFYSKWTPWIATSPLMTSLTILSAAYYQSDIRGLDVTKSPEIFTIQGRIISVINDHLKRKKMKDLDYEVVAAVMYLAINEWYWGDENSFWAHMKGLKEMLRLRGGVESMPADSLLRNQIILQDYQIACASERPLLLHADPLPPQNSPTAFPTGRASYPASHESPILISGVSFLSIHTTLSLPRPVADILDDMKFLTQSIRTFQTSSSSPQELSKFRATSLWTHNRILSLPAQLENVSIPLFGVLYEIIRPTALIYSAAILARIPLSKAHSPGQVAELSQKMWQVSLSTWKTIPGIFLWILLVIVPCAEEKLLKKWAKMMIGTVAMHIGVENQEVAQACMRAFLGIQTWLSGQETHIETKSDSSRNTPSAASASSLADEAELKGKGKSRAYE